MKRSIAGTLIAATLAAVALPASAQVQAGFFVNAAPPAPLVEVVPVPRVGFVWAPGFWDWRHGRYFWVAGRWERHRAGHVYYPVTWVRHNGHYYRHGGWH
jgi:YXWGXW repeat-containing protein